MDNQVECYCGASYAERPQALFWQGCRLPVTRVQSQWRTPTGLVFCVTTTGDLIFRLIYLQDQDIWQVEAI